MRTASKLFIIVAMFLTINQLYAKGYAHDKDELYLKTKHEHTHSCAAKEELFKKGIQRAARKRLWMLTQEKKVVASWLEVPIVSTDKKKFGYNVEWVVNLKNSSIEDKNKQNIFIFVDLYGHVKAVNYTGK